MSVCKYDWSYYYWSLFCNLTIVISRKYLKSDKSWSMVWIFVMTPNFSYFVQLKNRYCYVKLLLSPTLDFLCFLWHWHHGWRSVRCIHLGLLSRHISWVVGDSFYNTIFEFYTRWQYISLTSHYCSNSGLFLRIYSIFFYSWIYEL